MRGFLRCVVLVLHLGDGAVKLEGTIHCEGPECERSAHLGVSTMDAGRLVPGFVKITVYGNSRDYTHAFCGNDCLMKWAAQFPPEEAIEIPPGFFGEPKEGDDGAPADA